MIEAPAFVSNSRGVALQWFGGLLVNSELLCELLLRGCVREVRYSALLAMGWLLVHRWGLANDQEAGGSGESD